MGLFVNTNVSSLNAQRNLFDSAQSLSTSFERLSSGFRINRAADDAAGLQISNRLTAQINGLNQAIRHARLDLAYTLLKMKKRTQAVKAVLPLFYELPGFISIRDILSIIKG